MNGLFGTDNSRYLLQPAQSLIDLIYIKRLGVEVTANPFPVFIVFRMIGAIDGLQEIIVAWYSSHVFRGTGSSPRQTDGVLDALLRRKDLLYDEHVLPVVAAEHRNATLQADQGRGERVPGAGPRPRRSRLAAKKAAQTRKWRSAGKKAARTRKRRAAARKAAATRKLRSAEQG